MKESYYADLGSDSAPIGSVWKGRIAIVGGSDHVGLPLAMAFAKLGLQVDLVDTGAERVGLVNRSIMPFKEDGADELLPTLIRSGRLRATTESDVIGGAECAIVTIGTPVADFGDPSIGAFDRA